MGFIDDFADDVLGLDPNGGGIYDVPVIGNIIDDQLGLDPSDSGVTKLLKIAGWATLGTAAAGAAGVGPLAGTAEAIKSGASISEILPSWSSLTGAEQAAVTGELAGTSALQGITGPELLSGINTAVSTGGTVLSGLASTGAGGDTSGNSGGFWSTVGDIAGAAGNIAGAVGAGAELYNAVSGEGAEADRDLARGTVAEVAPFTADQQQGFDLARGVATDPRVAQGVDSLYGAQQRGSGALNTGLDTLTGIATGDDATTNRLASQAAAARDLSASNAGVLGGARSERASQTAAADVIAKRQQAAANTLTSTGQGLLGQGANAYNLGQGAANTLLATGGTQQQQQQNINAVPAAQNRALIAQGLRQPTTGERIEAAGVGLQGLPTVLDQTRQGVNSLQSLFR